LTIYYENFDLYNDEMNVLNLKFILFQKYLLEHLGIPKEYNKF